MDPATQCSIVPPFMLEALAQSDDPVVAKSASQALSHDEHFRYSRRSGGRRPRLMLKALFSMRRLQC